MSVLNQIQQLLIKYVAREISVRELRQQFIPLFFAVNRTGDAETTALADNVERIFGDLLAGEISEDRFRVKLVQLTPIMISELRFEWAFASEIATAAPANSPIKNQGAQTQAGAQIIQLAYAC